MDSIRPDPQIGQANIFLPSGVLLAFCSLYLKRFPQLEQCQIIFVHPSNIIFCYSYYKYVFIQEITIQESIVKECFQKEDVD